MPCREWTRVPAWIHDAFRRTVLLPDEDPVEFQRHKTLWLAVWSPRDLNEQEATTAAIRAL